MLAISPASTLLPASQLKSNDPLGSTVAFAGTVVTAPANAIANAAPPMIVRVVRFSHFSPLNRHFPDARPIRASWVSDSIGAGRQARSTAPRLTRHTCDLRLAPRLGVNATFPAGIGTHFTC